MSQVIKVGDYVMLKMPSTNQKMVVIKEKGTVSLGKFGSFPTSDIIGKPYGLLFEIINERAVSSQNKFSFEEVAETEANNQHIVDNAENQKISQADIEVLKNKITAGDTTAKEVIEHVVANHSKFDEKTEYSKAKYIKRKEKKFLRFFIPLVPSTFNICEFFHLKNPSKIKDLRMDTLSQMLTIGNVQPNSKILVVEDTNGLVLSSILDRMGGLGHLVYLYDTDYANIDVLRYYNFEQKIMDPLFTIRWEKFGKDYVPEELEPIPDNISEVAKVRNQKKIKNREDFIKNHALLHQGDFDGLFIASSTIDPYSIIAKLSPLLAPSRPIVVYSMHKEILINTSIKLKDEKQYLNPILTESWLRKYQVLPSRTHPEMNTSAQAGYLLSTTKVLDLGDSTPITSKVINSEKKLKVEES
ncbi:Gcd10p-domain-containing protein [Neoconidiobolus thromboides FSU 785]|nr:Gcd10p-domain-containing protein [Neoconidiobolus thromboides FSU 785]